MMAFVRYVLKLDGRNLCDSVPGGSWGLGDLMLRLLAAVWIVLAFGTSAAFAIEDRGPPYTDEQFLALAPERLPRDFLRMDMAKWWARAPAYLRQRVLNSPSEMWWPIIMCNFQGFKPGGVGNESAEKCEREAYAGAQRVKKSWSPDGQWIGPSEECVKRDKRSQWGELICD
jgi:hypothetical protein